MPSDDTAALVVALSAQLTKFESDMTKAWSVADRGAKRIEDRFSSMNLGGQAIDALGSKLAKLATIAGIGEMVAQIQELTEQAAKIGESAERVGIATDEYQKLRYALVATGASADAAESFLNTFSNKMAEAARGSGDLYNFLRVNGVAIKDASGNLLPLTTLLAKYSELVRNTASPQNQMNEAMMVAGRQVGPQVLQFLKLGAQGWSDFGDKAQKAGAILSGDTIARARELDDEFKKMKLTIGVTAEEIAVGTWDLLARSISNVTSGIKEFLEQLGILQRINNGAKGDMGFGPVSDGIGFNVPGVGMVPAFTGTNTPLPKNYNFSTGVDMLKQGFGKSTSDFSSFPGYNNNSAKQYSDQADALTKLIAAQEKRVDELDAERQAVGQTVYEETYAKTFYDLINQAKQKNITITAGVAQQLQDEAQKTAEAAQQLDDYKKRWQGVNSAAQFAGSQLIDIMDGLRTGTLSAADAARQLANNLINALEQAVLLGQGPLANVLGLSSNVSGGTGGLIGTLLGAFTGSGGGTGGIGHNALGTNNWRGGLTTLSEQGQEAAVLPKGTQIIPSSVLSRMNGNGNVSITLNNAPAGTDPKVSKQQKPDGLSMIIDLAVNKIKSDYAAGSFDAVNRGRYGLRPNKVRG